MARVEMKCGLCNGSYVIEDGIPPEDWVQGWTKIVQTWGTNHACVRPAATSRADAQQRPYPPDWREDHIGKMCAVCHIRMQYKEDITTVLSRAIHIKCRRCFLCLGERPYTMIWKEVEEGSFRLVHVKCWTSTQKSVEQFLRSQENERGHQDKAEQEVISVPSEVIEEVSRSISYPGYGTDPVRVGQEWTTSLESGNTSSPGVYNNPHGERFSSPDTGIIPESGITWSRDDQRESVVGEDLDQTERAPGD